jgi:hypothetical protein
MPNGKDVLYASTFKGSHQCPTTVSVQGKYLWSIYPDYDIFVANPKGEIIKRLTVRFKYDNKLEKMVVLVDRDEMEKLKHNYGFDEIMKRKKEKILRDKKRLVSKKPQLIRNLDWMETPPVQYKVKFRLTDINEVDDKVVVSVVIDDVVKREGNKSIKSDENYTKG